jgi:hypothetical protein
LTSGQRKTIPVGGTPPSWWQDWRGECAAIIGAGPSAKTAGVEKLKDRIHVIAINESHKLCPWADVLYSCDADWWQLRAGEVKNFSGIRLTLDDPPQAHKVVGVNKLKIPKTNNLWVNDFLFDPPGVVGSGGNSGFQMINLAAQFGATGIALVAFDMGGGNGVHWHGLHPSPLRNPDHARFYEWRKSLDQNASKLTARGIDVVNCSPVSALTAFPKMTIEQMLERWGL